MHSTGSEHSNRLADARRILEQLKLRPSPAHECSYLPHQFSRDLAFRVRRLPLGLYRSFMDLNFRRSGTIIYRPACDACDQCRAIRVPVSQFRPNRSQRRCWIRNQDVTAGLCPPVPTREKHQLYGRYLEQRHNRKMDGSWEAFCDFLYTSPVETLEVVYRRKGRLLGVSILDFDGDTVSTVYCYFDPDDRRALGTFNILWTIEYCRRLGIPWLYLGYAIQDCPNMNYKTRFQPNEILTPQGDWVRTNE